MSRAQTLLHPPTLRLIYLTLIVGLILAMIPFSSQTLRWLPDVLSMLLLYWAINLPRKVNLLTAFAFGLLADLFTGVPFGQHALAYSISTYLVLFRQPQLVMFNLGMQSAVVGALLLLNLLVMTLVRLALGAAFVSWSIYLSPLVGALLWPMLDKLMVSLCHWRKI